METTLNKYSNDRAIVATRVCLAGLDGHDLKNGGREGRRKL